MATSTILLFPTNNTLQEVLGITELTDIWDKLESLYKLKSLTSRLYLKKRLFFLQMMEEADFNQHLHEFNKITAESDSLEVRSNKKTLFALLPSSLDNIVTMFGKETLRLDRVVAALLMSETRWGNNGFLNDGHVAIVTKQSSSRRG